MRSLLVSAALRAVPRPRLTPPRPGAKTVPLAADASVEGIETVSLDAWKMGLKSVAV
jgi:hypothetical protein